MTLISQFAPLSSAHSSTRDSLEEKLTIEVMTLQILKEKKFFDFISIADYISIELSHKV